MYWFEFKFCAYLNVRKKIKENLINRIRLSKYEIKLSKLLNTHIYHEGILKKNHSKCRILIALHFELFNHLRMVEVFRNSKKKLKFIITCIKKLCISHYYGWKFEVLRIILIFSEFCRDFGFKKILLIQDSIPGKIST